MNHTNPWKTLESRIVYENPWLRLREDRVVRPDGAEGIYGVVEMRPSIGVVVLNHRDEVALVGQWRYAHNKFSWEVPTGGSTESDELILDAARRELQEETGIIASEWTPLGSIDNSNGATTDVAHLFLATGITILRSTQDPEERLVTDWISFSRVVDMVMEGLITESCSVAAILKVDRLRRNDVGSGAGK